MRRWSSLLCLIHIIIIAQGQNEGDVRLMDNGGATFRGVLQVYTQNKWNIVCYNRGYINEDRTAAAACRTLGHATYSNWGSAISLGYDVNSTGGNYQPTAINGIRCPNVINIVTEGELFLMRCDVGQVINSTTCDPKTIVGINCNTSINNYYNGQVRITSYESNHVQNDVPLLEIYLEDNWRPICVNSVDVNWVFVDSACRQMGYTNADTYHPPFVSITNIKSWNINILSVCSAEEGVLISYPCLTDCMNHSSYTSLDGCDDHGMHFIVLTCQFTKADQVIWSSGNQFICQVAINTASNMTTMATVDSRIFYSVTGLLSLFSMMLLVIVIVQCYHRRKADDPAQPNFVLRWSRRYGTINQEEGND